MYCLELIDFMALILHFKTDQTSVVAVHNVCHFTGRIYSLWLLTSLHQHKHVTILFGVFKCSVFCGLTHAAEVISVTMVVHLSCISLLTNGLAC